MKIVDCNCSYGRTSRPPYRYAAVPSELLEEMDFCGIDEALIFHTNQRFASPQQWNLKLVSDISSFRERLFPTWAILPTACGELGSVEQFMTDMRKNGIRALRAFPQEHRYCLDKVSFPDLFLVMAQKRIPLFVKENLLEVKNLLTEIPDLIVVAVNQGPHSLDRYLWPLMDNFPNLYVETSYLLVEGVIEKMCERYGHSRLLFGSGFPDNASGGALTRLAQADIGEEARSAIAGLNLLRLLEGVRL